VEDLPGVDLVGPELVGSLHTRRRERGRGRGREGARVRQAAKQARRRREWEWEEQDGTATQHLLELKPEGPFTSTGRRSTELARTGYRCGLSWGWARVLEAHFELTEQVSIFLRFFFVTSVTVPHCFENVSSLLPLIISKQREWLQ